MESVLAASRALHLAGLIMAFGAVAFGLLVHPRCQPAMSFSRDWRRLCLCGVWVALVGAFVWIPVQAGTLAGAHDAETVLTAVPVVVLDTGLGHALLLRLGLIGVAVVALLPREPRPWLRVVAVLAFGTVLALQVRMGHGAAATSVWLPFSVAVHILAASLWLGSLPPLLLLLVRDVEAGMQAARRFSTVGVLCVSTLGMSGVAAALAWVGGLAGLVGTPYGRVILVKVALLAVMIALALANRFRLSAPGRSGRSLRASVSLEMALGVAILLAAAYLATLSPGVHAQPAWPFERRLIPGILEDAYLRGLLVRFIVPAFAGGVLLMAAVLLRGPVRRILLAGAGVALLSSSPVPPPGLFLQPAAPTSFHTSPTGYSVASIGRGESLFTAHCAACHGEDARGRGPEATGDPAWPPDLTAPLFLDRRDGELFWAILDGITRPDGRNSMPAFREVLSDDDIWALVDFLRWNNYARRISMRGPDGAVAPIIAPRALLSCPDGTSRLGRSADRPALVIHGGTSIDDLDALPVRVVGAAGDCRFQEASAGRFFSGLVHWPEDAAFEETILIDGEGWIRAVWPGPGTPSHETLREAVTRIEEVPVDRDGAHAH